MIGSPPELVIKLTRAWALLYTRGLPTDRSAARRDELDSDLWEHEAWAAASGRSAGKIALEILGRLVAGIPADLSWRRLEGRNARYRTPRSARGETMDNKVNSGMVALTSVVGIGTVALGIMVAFSGGYRAQGGFLVVAGLLILGGLVAMHRGVRGARGIVALGTIVPATLAVWTIILPLVAIAIVAWLIISRRGGEPQPAPGH